MGDIAMIFHWPPDSMYDMALEELINWRAIAIDRHNAINQNESEA